ncbi:MAG: Sapep family Mn(2+)-dependent dipeptidase [Erysipelotrichaceae bacterium]|nr:Sapep family Mn(2+)-dependent dipeptidase [Erysipelotrichaceae bacterium]
MKQIGKKINEFENTYLNDLQKLIRIPSVHQDRSGKEEPFGKEIRNCFDEFLKIGERLGFESFDDEGYACGFVMGEGNEEIAVLGHLDVVDAGDPSLWNDPPYQLSNHDGILYGRGVNDDKGPLLAALYAMYLLKQKGLPFRRKIRLIAGGAEETTWEGIRHYFEKYPQPLFGFSPDGDFPIVNGEMGIMKFSFLFDMNDSEISIVSDTPNNLVCDHIIYKDNETVREYHGKRALSRHPERGQNAVWQFVEDDIPVRNETLKNCIDLLKRYFAHDNKGMKSGLYANDEKMGESSLCLTKMYTDNHILIVKLDLRYPATLKTEEIKAKLEEIAKQADARLQIDEEKKCLYLDENSEFIKALKDSYEIVIGEKADCIVKKGASYARALEIGVAFGASFPGEVSDCHMPNEKMPLSSLKKAIEIYYEALYRLTIKS